MEERFSWIPFYSELAKALLAYKDERKPLVDFVYSELSQTGQKIVLDDVLKDALENVLKDVQKDVLENALENVLETSASLAAYFKVNERTIRRDLSTLQAKRIICHIGPDKGGRWIILVSHK